MTYTEKRLYYQIEKLNSDNAKLRGALEKILKHQPLVSDGVQDDTVAIITNEALRINQ